MHCIGFIIKKIEILTLFRGFINRSIMSLGQGHGHNYMITINCNNGDNDGWGYVNIGNTGSGGSLYG